MQVINNAFVWDIIPYFLFTLSVWCHAKGSTARCFALVDRSYLSVQGLQFLRKFPIEWYQSRLRLAQKRHWRNVRRRSKKYQMYEQHTLKPPAVLSFREAYKDTVRFLDEFRDATLTRSKRTFVYVDLSTVKRISVPVSIVLAAEFDRWQRKIGARLIPKEVEKWDPSVRDLLSDLGVFELLGIPNRHETDFQKVDNITLTQLISGLKLDGQKLSRLQSRFRSMLEGFTTNTGVYEGLSEAVENAIYHAYPTGYEPRHPFAGHRWWGAGCLEISSMRLRFFVFDQGAGIPHTLPANDFYEEIRSWISRNLGGALPNDTLMLRAALETGRTRTGASHRGLGLKRMAEVIEGTSGGYLRIVSRMGEIVYQSDGKIVSRDHSESIGGTLIEWCLPADALTSSREGPNEVD